MGPTERAIVSTSVVLPYPLIRGQEKIRFLQHCIVFRRVRKIAQNDYRFLNVCPTAWNDSALTRGIFMKFDT
jgi:hypothetical protein